MNEASGKKGKKRKKWPIVVGIIAAVAVAGFIFISSRMPSMDMLTGAYQQATVGKGSIVNTVVGSGNLEYGDSVDIKMPTDIKVEEVYVEEGDRVESGQALAKVDMTSLRVQLADIQEQIEDLDEELNSTKDDTATEVIKSHVAGRVKVIDAAEGSEAADIMVEHGSLMTISIDGKMAVDFESSASLSNGDDVDVILPDESTKEGTVVQSAGGSYTVTLTDNGPEVGDTVKIQDADGNAIGGGTLYINNPITIAGTGGVIDTVHVEENDSVSKGSKLVTLDGVDMSAEHIEQQSQRAELMEKYNALVALSKTGTVTAGSSGTIEAVNITEGATVTATQAASGDSSQSSTDTSAQSQMSGMYTSASGDSDTPTLQFLSARPAGSANAEAVPLAAPADTVVEIADLPGVALAVPATGAAPQTAIDGSPAYAGTVQWQPADAAFSGGTSYTAAVSLTANAGYKFKMTIVPAAEGAKVTNIVVSADAEGNTLTFNATYPPTEAEQPTQQPNAQPTQQPTQSPATDDTQAQPEMGSLGDYSAMQGGGTVSGGSYGGSYSASAISGLSGSTGSTGTASADSSSGSTDTSGNEAVAFTIATDEEMVLAINIDELDINSITEGMDASIVFDAMEEDTYEGTIKSVSDSANSSSGVTKYTAKIYIPRDEKMRAGMNATATIVIEQLDDILTIPVDALQERGASVFVYTRLDAETGLPSGEAEVETGLSDGEFVEVTSGLSEGDTIYYIVNTSDDSGMMMFGGGNFGGGNVERSVEVAPNGAGGPGGNGGGMGFGG